MELDDLYSPLQPKPVCDSQRADLSLLKELVSKVSWESAFEAIGGLNSWLLFKSHFLRVQEQAIPMCHKSSKRGRRLAWLTRNLLGELRQQMNVYGLWKVASDEPLLMWWLTLAGCWVPTKLLSHSPSSAGQGEKMK